MESNPCFLTTNSDTPKEHFSVLLLHKCTENVLKGLCFGITIYYTLFRHLADKFLAMNSEMIS